MHPTLSYIIWFSQRTGSSLLCKALESTGIAGKPNEWLHAPEPFDLFRTYKVNTPEALQRRLWEVGTTLNGVFGLKLGMFEPHNTRMLDHFRQLPDCPQPLRCRADVWESAFPNCRHIFMTRRNKVRLAVSWWKAAQSEEWHRTTRDPSRAKDVRDGYDFAAIDRLLLEASLREAALQEFFTEGGIVPLTIVYEDFVADYYETVTRVLDFLGIVRPDNVTIDPPFYERLADEISEEWVQQFRKERQEGWKNVGW